MTGKIREEDIDELKGDAKKMRTIKVKSNKVSNAIGNLARTLRKAIHATNTYNGDGPVLSAKDSKQIRSLFTVRHLLRGHDDHLYFGNLPG